MPGQQEVLRVFDVPQSEEDKEAIIGFLDEVDARIKKFSGVSLASKNANNIGEFKANAKAMEESITRVTALEKELASLREQNAKRRKAQTEDELRAQVAANLQRQQSVASIKDEIRMNQAAEGSLKQKRLQLKALQQAYDSLSASQKKSAEGVALKGQLNTKDREVKGEEFGSGRFGRNVGNYSGALKTLEASLTEAKAKMDKFTQAGQQNSEAAQKVAMEVSLLGQLVGQQSKGFTSLSREIMATGKALETMAEQGMQSSEAFKALEAQFVRNKQELNEFRKNQALLTSEAPKLQALTLAAKGLMGAYALGAGATALLADGNEKVEKELNKLVAVMTILQGLQEVHELLQKRMAISTIAAGIAQGFKNFVMTGSVKATQEANVAIEENIVAEGEQAAAIETTTVAVEGSTAAMRALRIALLASGIGALLILLPIAANAMDVFKKSTKEMAAEAEELRRVLDELNETIIRLAELDNKYFNDAKKSMEDLLELSDKQGANFYELMAIKKHIAEQDLKSASHLLMVNSKQGDINNAWRKTTDLIANQTNELQSQNDLLDILQGSLLKNFDTMSSSQRKTAQEEIDNQKKKIEGLTKVNDKTIKLMNDYNTATKNIQALDIETTRFSEQEKRDLALASVKVITEAKIRANEAVLSNTRSTEAQQLTAMRSTLQQHLAMINAEEKAKLDAPGNTPAKVRQITMEASAARSQAIFESRQQELKKLEEYNNRELEAEYEVSKLSTTTQAKEAEIQANDVKLSLEKRLAAYEDYETKQQALINLDANRQKQKAGLTKDELFKIEVERQQKLMELANEGRVKQSQIILSALETQRKGLEGGAQLDGLKGEVKALEELNQKFKDGKISLQAYKKEKDEISNKTSEQAIRIEIGALEFIRGEYVRYGQDTKDIDKAIYENKKHLTELGVKDAIDAAELKKQLGEREKELAKQAETTTAELIKGGYERELNSIQKQIDANNKLKETQTANIESSSLSAQQKAAEQIELNAKVSAQNEALQRKQRDVKVREAEFDRAKAIFDIGVNTAVSIIKTNAELGMAAALPFDIVAAAMGAAQIAAVMAKPIPKYESGVLSSPEGLALLHPGEMRVDPSGKMSMTPDKGESLTYLERGTRIIPANDVKDMLLQNFLNSSARMMAPSMADERLLHEVRDLKQAIVEGNRAHVGAIGRMKAPVVHVHNDASFIAHIKNATS